MRFVPGADEFGAEVHDCCLDEDLGEGLSQVFREALAKYRFLWFRSGRRLTWRRQVDLANLLGGVTTKSGRPFVQDFHDDTFRYWHSDIVLKTELPPRFTVLHCLVSAGELGDTLLLHNGRILEQMPPDMRREIERSALFTMPSIAIVRHPERGGEDTLFFNLQTVKLDPKDRRKKAESPDWQSLPPDHARQLRLGYALHDYLDGIAAKEEPGIFARIRWSEGDTLIWDNFGTSHSATLMEEGIRWMRRVVVRNNWSLDQMGLQVPRQNPAPGTVGPA